MKKLIFVLFLLIFSLNFGQGIYFLSDESGSINLWKGEYLSSFTRLFTKPCIIILFQS